MGDGKHLRTFGTATPGVIEIIFYESENHALSEGIYD